MKITHGAEIAETILAVRFEDFDALPGRLKDALVEAAADAWESVSQ